MNRKSHRWGAVLLLAVIFAAICTLTATAYALERDVALRFMPSPSSEVAGYVVYATDQSTLIEYVLDVGFVEPESDGIARIVVVLDAEASFLVTMTAYNAEGESDRSNQIRIPSETTVCDPTLCDDNRACTVDSCDAGGCLHTPLPDGSVCNDSNVETADDECVAGVCEGTWVVCRENLDCDDGNICNGLETCGGTACFEGDPLDCGTASPCTTAFCDRESGCGLAPVEDGTPCDDGRDATTGDVCLAGVCQGTGQARLLSVDAVSPRVVSPGRHRFRIHGLGFEPGGTLRFEYGKGPAPRVRSLFFLDGQTLEADVEVSRKGPKRSRFWDLVVTLPDKSQARLTQAVRVNP